MGMIEYGQVALRIEDIKEAELTRKPTALSKLVLLEYLEESLHMGITGVEMFEDEDDDSKEEIENYCKNDGWMEVPVRSLEETLGIRPPKQVALLKELQKEGKLKVSLRGMPATRSILLPSIELRVLKMKLEKNRRKLKRLQPKLKKKGKK